MLAPIPLSNYLSKLERRLPLRDSDRAAVLALPAAAKRVAPGEIILDDCHDAAGSLVILSRGFAVASRMMPQDRRHIAAFVLPSDALNLAAIVTGRQTLRVQAQGEAELVVIERADVTALMETRPEVARALWLDTLGDAAIAEAWAANVGQRRGRSRLAHLLLELRHRFAAIGALENGGFRLAGNQSMLADALGFSLVHLNKSLSALRLDGDVTVSNHIYRILDPDRLAAAVGFDPAYLR